MIPIIVNSFEEIAILELLKSKGNALDIYVVDKETAPAGTISINNKNTLKEFLKSKNIDVDFSDDEITDKTLELIIN